METKCVETEGRCRHRYWMNHFCCCRLEGFVQLHLTHGYKKTITNGATYRKVAGLAAIFTTRTARRALNLIQQFSLTCNG